MNDKPMNVYQRLHAVMQKINYVRKDAEVTGAGSYKAVTHDMVTALVRPHFVEQGIIVVPRLTSGVVVDTGRTTKSGTPIIRFQGEYEVSFVNMNDPADSLVIPVAAHAEDQGDKAPGKALSYATKMAILKVLLIESGDADESRIAPLEEEQDPLSEEELAGFKKQIDEAATKDAIKAVMQRGFNAAKEAGDAKAHAEIKAYTVARLEKMK